MTFDEMLTFVRSQADADETDAPTAVLQVHARVAYNDILSRRAAWDFLEVAYTVTTTPGDSEYPLSGLSVDDMDTVYAVSYTTGGVLHRLTYMTRQDAELQFGLTTATALPTAYTVANDVITLFPTPSDALTLTVRGFRRPAVWPNGVGSSPDLPDEFHDAIAWYMLSGFYMSQEDTQMAGVYLQEYQAQVDRLLGAYSGRQFSQRPKVMGGQNGGRRSFLEHVRGQLE